MVIDMRRLFVMGIALFLVGSLTVFAGYGAGKTKAMEKSAKPADVMTLKGVIVDNNCAGANEKDLATFVKTHPKSCALMPKCAATGYSIYSDGKLYKFDKASNDKVRKFLEEKDSKLEVVVKAEKVGDEWKVESIENQTS